ncbi:MAG: thioesterase family protein [Deltaproteobacteria bacterium]|nr:thioesterase family protein [Deltaproteobacteria bacterium]
MDRDADSALQLREADGDAEGRPAAGYKYEYETRVTFCLTNAEGNVSHDQYARLFGVVRELFGLDFIPGFAEEAGAKYLLKTRNAAYEYIKDFFFGDVMKIQLYVSELTGASFTLAADYIHAHTGEIHARGSQQIVYTDMTGRPRRIPDDLKTLIKSVMMEEVRDAKEG